MRAPWRGTQQILFHDQTEESDGDRLSQREGWPVGKTVAPRPYGVARAITENITAPAQKAGGVNPAEQP